MIAARERFGIETVRRWIVQAEVEEDNAILKVATFFFVENSAPRK